MTMTQRRDFLRMAAAGAATAAATQGVLAQSIQKALAIPANCHTGTIRDVEHIVILMQENRSFDHYFGSMRGVRGFSDPRPVTLPSGKSVWHQPHGTGEVLPFHPGAKNLGLQFLQDLPHGWADTHAAWNNGKYDQWVPAKGTTTMAYLTRQDIPFHYQLADAFTICDAYHCSLLGPTDPNRYYMWTGWVGNDGLGGGPVISNAEAGYGWSTFPEALESAGVSWKIYQDVGTGLDAAGFWGWTSNPYIGNYGDNSLLYFHQYQNALPGSALHEKAVTGTNISAGDSPFDILKRDVAAGTLPQVSWIVAPEAYTEHPNWPANYGAWYVDQVLTTLTSNPDLWSKTALFITYDENDGFFDHIVPPSAPSSRQNGASTVDTANEFFAGDASNVAGPYGLGPRVPMIVVSPWTAGGWVCSQVFDHTSLIRFIERRFGSEYAIAESNITPWRRAVCGDLTSAFDFSKPSKHAPQLPEIDTTPYKPKDALRHADYVPAVPAQQALPKQERGLKRARALPYELQVHGQVDARGGSFSMQFRNKGRAGAAFHVTSQSRSDGPWTYTLDAERQLSDTWAAPSTPASAYDFAVHGPNGFLCEFKGSFAVVTQATTDARQQHGMPVRVEVTYRYETDAQILVLRMANHGPSECHLTVVNAYTGGYQRRVSLRPGEKVEDRWHLQGSYGWYDLQVTAAGDTSFLRRIAGHLENGRSSASDPALGLG